MAYTKITVVKDNVDKTVAAMTKLIGKQVLVGIPETKASRKDEPEMNNATLGYIHEFGSPASNIPARPFLLPGMKKSRTAAIYQLKIAARAALDGDMQKMDAALGAAGTVCSNAVRNEFYHNNWPALQPSTVLNRNRSRGTKSHRKSELLYLALISGVDNQRGMYGMSAEERQMSPEEAQTKAGIRPLMNTLQLLRSITYVIRSIK